MPLPGSPPGPLAGLACATGGPSARGYGRTSCWWTRADVSTRPPTMIRSGIRKVLSGWWWEAGPSGTSMARPERPPAGWWPVARAEGSSAKRIDARDHRSVRVEAGDPLHPVVENPPHPVLEHLARTEHPGRPRGHRVLERGRAGQPGFEDHVIPAAKSSVHHPLPHGPVHLVVEHHPEAAPLRYVGRRHPPGAQALQYVQRVGAGLRRQDPPDVDLPAVGAEDGVLERVPGSAQRTAAGVVHTGRGGRHVDSEAGVHGEGRMASPVEVEREIADVLDPGFDR